MAADQHSTIIAMRCLVEQYQADGTSLADFEDRFLSLHSTVPGNLPHELAEVVDELFWAVESYVPDPELRDSGDTGDEELRAAVRRARVALARLE